MKDQSKTKQALIQELASLRERITELEQAESERKQAEETLQKSEEKYRSLLENINDGVYILDSSGKFTFVNDVIVKRSGYPTEWFLGRSYLDVISEKDRERVQKHFNEVMDGKTQIYDLSYPSESGNLLHVQVSTAPLFDGAKVIGLLGVSRDITERKRVEDTLRESEEKFRTIYDRASDGILIADAKNKNFLQGNKTICSMLGYTKEEIDSLAVDDIHPPNDVSRVLDEFEKLMKEEKALAEGLPVLRKDGTIFYADISSTSITLGGIPYLVGIFRNITERKQAEEALRESEERFKNLYQESPIPTFTWQKKGDNFILVDFNRAAIQITNGKVRDRLGNSAVELYKNSPQILSDMNLCFQERSIVRRELTSRHFAPGRFLSVHYGFISPDLIIVHTEDQTTRKHAEELLRRTEENFRRSLDDSPLGMRIATIEGETIYANRVLLDFYGYDSIEDLKTTPIENRYAPESITEHEIRREKRKRGDDTPSEYEIGIIGKDGEIRHLQVFRKEILWDGERQFQVIYQDITRRKQAEEWIHASLREKELLLREVHHRVKNNMQVISGLLDLQVRSSGNPELTVMLNESQSRIRSMAMIHEQLYGSKDFAKIDLAGYVIVLSKELSQLYKVNSGKIDLIIQADGEVYVDINKAIPCGLILNELISNALKHAFPDDGPGEIKIIIGETKNTEIEIVVRDNGMGLPDDVDIREPRTVGLHLVNGLVKKQLDGQIEVRRDNGTEFRIKFPL